MYDDVAWEQGGSPVDSLQIKHHIAAARSLGDKDDDIWRTIRAWMDTYDCADPDGPWLTLVTTQTARDGTAMAALRATNTRDPVRAMDLLTSAAEDSRAEGSERTRRRYLELDPMDRAVFVSRMRVIDAAPIIADIDAAVRSKLRPALPLGHEASFMRQLWGWWHEQAVEMLRKRLTSVSVDRLMRQVSRFRDDYSEGKLPTLVDRRVVPLEEVQDKYGDACFVRQLEWVGATRQLDRAIMDYYRAYTQTLMWLEDDLVDLDELARFEENLVDEWSREFDWMLTSLGDDATEDMRRAAGSNLLRKVLDQTLYRVRDRYDDPFFSRGKHHELADCARIGWHPEFEERVRALTRVAHG